MMGNFVWKRGDAEPDAWLASMDEAAEEEPGEQRDDYEADGEDYEAHANDYANGSEEAHSDDPELWDIDGTEMDLLAKYKVGGQMWYLQDRAKDAVKKGPMQALSTNPSIIESMNYVKTCTVEELQEGPSDSH